VVQVNTEENPRLALRFAVTGIPVVHLLHKGKSVDQLSGAQPTESMVTWFRLKERD